jgi:hypothetical protein
MGVLANVFGGSTGQFGGGPTAVTAQSLTNEGFDLTKPFIQDVLEAGRAQFFEDTTDPETGDTIQQLAPFEQFTGPRLADFSSEQQEALTGLAALGRQGLATTPDLSSSAPYFQQAKQQAGLGSLAFTEADADRLMNPFLRGVTDTAKREAIRQYEGTIQPKLDASAVQAGSFGGSRAAILEAEAQRNLQQQLSDIEERGLATAFEQAQRGFESERGRQLQSSALFSGLGEAAPAQAARELALLSSTGEAKQAQEQAALNLAEKDFIEQREFPLRQLQEYQSLVRGFPFTPSTYQVTTQQQPQPSFGQQLLGTLGTGVGLFGALGGFKNKTGGQVVPRQSGGQVRGGLAGLERHQSNVPVRPAYNPTFRKPPGTALSKTILGSNVVPSSTQADISLPTALRGAVAPRGPDPRIAAIQKYQEATAPLVDQLKRARLDAAKLTPEEELYRSELKDIDFAKRREDIKESSESEIEDISQNKWLRIMNLGLATLGQEGGVSGLQAVGKASQETNFVEGLLDDAKAERNAAKKQRDNLLKIDDQELSNLANVANISKADQRSQIDATIAGLEADMSEADTALKVSEKISGYNRERLQDERSLAELLLKQQDANNDYLQALADLKDKDKLTSGDYNAIRKAAATANAFTVDPDTGQVKVKGVALKPGSAASANLEIDVYKQLGGSAASGKFPDSQKKNMEQAIKTSVKELKPFKQSEIFNLVNRLTSSDPVTQVTQFVNAAISNKVIRVSTERTKDKIISEILEMGN